VIIARRVKEKGISVTTKTPISLDAPQSKDPPPSRNGTEKKKLLRNDKEKDWEKAKQQE
jgi:hypothetical protein